MRAPSIARALPIAVNCGLASAVAADIPF